MQRQDHHFLWLITGISIAIAIGLVVSHLSYAGLWIDEIYTLHAVSLPWREMFLERLMRGHFPLYFALMKLWLTLAGGASEIALRAPSFFFWLASTALFGWLAFRHLRRDTAALSTLFFALNGLAIRQASEARMYTVVLLFSVAICFSYLTLAKSKNNKLATFTLVTVPLFAFWTSSTAILTIIALLFDAFRRRHRQTIILLCVSLLLILVSALVPAVVHVTSREHSEIAHVPPLVVFLHFVTCLSGIIGWEDYYKLSWAAYGLQVLGAAVTVGACAFLFRKWSLFPEEVRTSAVIVFFPLLLMLVTYVIEKTVGWKVALHGPARYVIGSLPFAAVLSGFLLSKAFLTARRRYVVAVAWATVLILNALVVVRLRLETPRELLRYYLGKQYVSSDAVVVVPPQAVEAVKMYAPQVTVNETFPRGLETEELHRKLSVFASTDRLWLIWIHGKGSKAVDVADALFGKGVSSSPKRYIGERRIFLYRPRFSKQQMTGSSANDETLNAP